MRAIVRLVVVALAAVVGAGLLEARVTGQAAPLPVDPPATCDARLLDVQEELVNTQELLAEWQARAIRAEARLARAVIADRRRALTPAAPAAKDDR